LSLKREVANDNKDQNNFNPNFVNKSYNSSDLLWQEVAQNFDTVLPHKMDVKAAEAKQKDLRDKQIEEDDHSHEKYLYFP